MLPILYCVTDSSFCVAILKEWLQISSILFMTVIYLELVVAPVFGLRAVMYKYILPSVYVRLCLCRSDISFPQPSHNAYPTQYRLVEADQACPRPFSISRAAILFLGPGGPGAWEVVVVVDLDRGDFQEGHHSFHKAHSPEGAGLDRLHSVPEEEAEVRPNRSLVHRAEGAANSEAEAFRMIGTGHWAALNVRSHHHHHRHLAHLAHPLGDPLVSCIRYGSRVHS